MRTESTIFTHLEEKAAQIVDLFARLGGGCWSTLSTSLATGLQGVHFLARSVVFENVL